MSRFKGNQLTVAITGLNANDNPGAGIGVIRALRDKYGAAMKVIGLAYETLEPGVYMDELIDRVYHIPFTTAGPDALIKRLLEIDAKEQIDIVIPNFDSELENFIRIARQLDAKGIHMFLPDLEQLRQRDKVNLAEFGKAHNIAVPKSATAANLDEFKKALDELEYPLMIKGRLYEAYYVTADEEAEKTFHRMIAKWGAPVILQQYVKGSEINIAGLGNGNLISAVAMRKQYITDKGKAWAGITIIDQSLMELAERFVKACNWKGAFELELLRSHGETYLLEVNPRFPAWIYLASAAGQNQPAYLVDMAIGEKPTVNKAYDAGKMFVRYAWDNIVDVSRFQQFSSLGQIFYK